LSTGPKVLSCDRHSLSTIAHVAPRFATLLSLPFEGRYAGLDLTPREQKERAILALNGLLSGLAQKRPALLILEEGHWIDPTTLELFTRTIDRLQRWPVLLIVTFRPSSKRGRATIPVAAMIE
jgi:predicted ATPase